MAAAKQAATTSLYKRQEQRNVRRVSISYAWGCSNTVWPSEVMNDFSRAVKPGS